jgi:hypothetical protein
MGKKKNLARKIRDFLQFRAVRGLYALLAERGTGAPGVSKPTRTKPIS